MTVKLKKLSKLTTRTTYTKCNETRKVTFGKITLGKMTLRKYDSQQMTFIKMKITIIALSKMTHKNGSQQIILSKMISIKITLIK